MENPKKDSETTKKEWKWPMGILAFYLTFVTLTLGFVFFTFTVHFDLVSPDYYERTLAYQEHIDSESNAMSLEHPLSWEISEGELILQFPSELIASGLSGAIVLYRPSNASLDREIQVEADGTGFQRISLAAMAPGHWEMHVRWASDGKAYFSKSDMLLP